MDQKERAHQRRRELVFGISKPGFTLIEILVAIAIIAVVATAVIPNLWQRKPYYERQQCVRNFNALSNMAWQKAITTHKIHKVHVDFARRTVFLQVESDDRDEKGDPVFVPVKGAYTVTSFVWPKNLEIRNFYIENFDEMSKYTSGQAKEAWYFVYPEGRAQPVTINMIDTKDRYAGKPRHVGLVLNPFSALFKEYDTFQQ